MVPSAPKRIPTDSLEAIFICKEKSMVSEKQPGGPEEEIFARGKLFELVHVTQPDGRVFEVARRAPGVRTIIADKENRKLLLTREFRRELGGWDYRLPGGKVYDTLDEYEAARKSGQDMEAAALSKAKGESEEEAGIRLKDAKVLRKSTLGATVEWDLWVVEATEWEEAEGQKLEAGEQIETGNWYDYHKVEEMILGGQMQEERIALVLLQWLHQQEGEKG
jgi:ADP-ribose pyrophosphatase